MTCPRGHRVIPSTGECWTIVEVERDTYRYVVGPRDELPDPTLPAAPAQREVA